MTEEWETLAENESLEDLFQALYSALEADLSSKGWPENSQSKLEAAFDLLEDLYNYLEI